IAASCPGRRIQAQARALPRHLREPARRSSVRRLGKASEPFARRKHVSGKYSNKKPCLLRALAAEEPAKDARAWRRIRSVAFGQGSSQGELFVAIDGFRAAIAASKRTSQGSDFLQHRPKARSIDRHRL